MASSTGPNLGLQHSWTLGENGWNIGMDANLKKLDTVVALSVLGTANDQTGTDTAGDRYIVGSSPAGEFAAATAGDIAVYDGSVWAFYTPAVGWLLVDAGSSNSLLKWTGSAWNLVGDGGGGDAMPAGAVTWFAADAPPAGFLACDGAAVSRTTYAGLFAVVGETHGAGDGSTTFNLPDLRGEFVRGWDNGRGVDSGRTFGAAQADAMQGHGHLIGKRLYGDTAGSKATLCGLLWDDIYGSDSEVVEAPVSDGTNGTPRTAAETRPRNVALLACIKY